MPMSSRVLAEFDGPVECRYGIGAVAFVLSGAERGSGAGGGAGHPLQVLFSGASGAPLPGPLRDVEVLERVDERSHHFWQVGFGGRQFDIIARSVQVHRSAAQAFLRAVPPVRVPLTERLGWTMLLLVLRVPGVARVAGWLRA
jgi:hypothetical protein